MNVIREFFNIDGTTEYFTDSTSYISIDAFPKHAKYKDRFYALSMYSDGMYTNYRLQYTELNRNIMSSDVFNDLEYIQNFNTSCECGSDKLGHPGHSHWCPKA